MQVSVEPISALARRVTVELPWTIFEAAEKKELEAYRKKAKIPGFRPGKAPLDLVKRHADIRPQVIYGLMKEHTKAAVDYFLTENESGKTVELVQAPEYDLPVIAEGESIKLNYIVELLPEITLPDLSGVEIKKKIASVTPADVDQTIEKLRKQFQTWEKVSRPAEEGDRLMLDFEGRIDGELFEGGAAQGVELILGSKKMIPGFETALIGFQVNDNRPIEVTFPAEYHEASLAGKVAVFQIHVHQIESPVLPVIDDLFIKNMGIADGDMTTFRTELESNMSRELKNALKEDLKQQILKQVLELTEFELPEFFVNNELNEMHDRLEKRFKMKIEKSRTAEMLAQSAKERVKLALLMRDIIHKNDLKPDQALIQEMLNDRASMFEDSEDMLSLYANRPETINELEHLAVEQQVINLLLSQMSVSDIESNFFEVMNKDQAK